MTNFESDDPSAAIDPLSYRDAGGDTLLHIAARLGDMDTIKWLVDAGMNINEQGEMGSTALHNAYQYRNTEIVEFLLDQGASPKTENYFGKLPRDYAV